MLLQMEQSLSFSFSSRTASASALGVLSAGSQNMEGEPLGVLGADAGQLLEFFNEPRHGLGKSRQSRLL